MLGAGLLGVVAVDQARLAAFYALTSASPAPGRVGGLASGPLHLGWIAGRRPPLRRPVVTPVATGVGAFGAFYAAALVVRRIPVLDGAISPVLAYAKQGTDPLVLPPRWPTGRPRRSSSAARSTPPLAGAARRRRSTAVYAGDRGHPQPGAGARRRRDGHAVRAAAPGDRRDPGADADPPDLVDADGALPAAAVPRTPTCPRGEHGVSIGVVLFTRDLRVHDNPRLVATPCIPTSGSCRCSCWTPRSCPAGSTGPTGPRFSPTACAT